MDNLVNIAGLKGWTPIRVFWEQSSFFVDWCYTGERSFTEPFFDQTIGSLIEHPFHLAFRRRTPLETLKQLQAERPGLPPTGFIFHLSRCGSTLVSQMLAALPQNIVISEASPIDSVIRAHLKDTSLTDERRIEWLRGLVNALGQPRTGRERYFFVKFDSWHTLHLSLIRRAFPEVPWIFLYRQPVEVIASQMKHRGAQMLPGIIEAACLKVDAATAHRMKLEEYCARVLEKFCEAALASYRLGGGMLVNYHQLPEAVCTLLPEFFRAGYTKGDLERMRSAARFDAKNPLRPFADDTETKNRDATDEARRLAEQFVGPLYERLEALRQSQEHERIGAG